MRDNHSGLHRARAQRVKVGDMQKLVNSRLVLTACAPLWLFYLYLFLPYTVDDAGIYWRLGEHLSLFGRYSYNLTGAPFDPSSGTLYVLLSAAFSALHWPPLVASKVFGLFFMLAFAWRAWTVTKNDAASPWSVFPAVLVLLSPYSVIHSVSGLETPLFAWLLFEAIVLMLVKEMPVGRGGAAAGGKRYPALAHHPPLHGGSPRAGGRPRGAPDRRR